MKRIATHSSATRSDSNADNAYEAVAELRAMGVLLSVDGDTVTIDRSMLARYGYVVVFCIDQPTIVTLDNFSHSYDAVPYDGDRLPLRCLRSFELAKLKSYINFSRGDD